MSDTTVPNEEQIEYWNEKAGPRWVTMQERLDRQIEVFGRAAMERAKIAPGDSVLDVGCGCGGTSIAIGGIVGVSGAVLGVDISRPMLDRAEERARVGQYKKVKFAQADAQTHAFEEDTFDVAFSRFGVMFFEDPAKAFANIRTGLKPGGRLAFACWRGIQENPWMLEPMMAVAELVELPPPPEPHEPGPFALADEAYTRGFLEKAGYADIAIEAIDESFTTGGGGGLEDSIDFYFQIGPLSRLLSESDEATVEAVRKKLRETLAPRATADGILYPGAAWVVSAVA